LFTLPKEKGRLSVFFAVMENTLTILLGWKLTYDEVFNGVYEMQLTWERGPKVETKGTDFEDMLAWCLASALDIEALMRRRGPIS
jgi:hypothetical protein